MPEPRPNEPQDKFISRCISYMSKEKPENDQKQNIAVCYSLWRESKKKKEEEGQKRDEELRSALKKDSEMITEEFKKMYREVEASKEEEE